MAGDPSGDRGVSRPGGQGSKFYVLSSEPKEHKSFGPDTRPGEPVTEVTGQSFMCQSFMCLFCSLDVSVVVSFASQKRLPSVSFHPQQLDCRSFLVIWADGLRPVLVLTCFHASFFPFRPFPGHPSSSPFLGTLFSHFSPQKMLCSVEQGGQHRAWKGAVSGWTSPQISGRKFLPEILVKKGQC